MELSLHIWKEKVRRSFKFC